MTGLRFFELALARRGRLGLLVLALLAFFALGAARVVVDPSIERMHPFGDSAKSDFDRYRLAFPGQDAQCFVIVETAQHFTPAGLTLIAALEAELRVLPGVQHLTGLASTRGPRGLLIPLAARNSAEAIEQALAEFRSEPSARLLVHPLLPIAVIPVELRTGAGSQRIRAERDFAAAAAQVLARHAAPGLKLTLSGAPALRAELARLVEDDMALLLPMALLAILGLVALSYRDRWFLLATAATLVAAPLAMVGAMGWIGLPLGVLTSFAPLVILVVALTDTVHVLSDLDQRQRSGTPAAAALARAMAHAAGPCLATDVVIAGGFLAMGLIGLTAVWEFGLATALGVILAWGANMLVLPWVLSFRPEAPGPTRQGQGALQSAKPRPLDAVLAWVEHQVVARPRQIVALTVAVTLLSLISLTRLDPEYRVFDDLRPKSALATNLRYAEAALGGLVPLAVMIEPETARADAGWSPAALAFQQRIGDTLAALPERPPLLSLPRGLEPYEQSLGAGLLGRTPATTALALKQLARSQPLDSLLSADRSTAQVVALLPNVGSQRMRELVEEAKALAVREVPAGFRATVTGNLVMTEHVTAMLTQGLLSSFVAAIAVSFAAFFIVLRSARLALIGLAPNVLPVIVLFAMMPVLGIGLKPSTVIIASMALVIADDDTLQYLLRFQRAELALQAQGVVNARRQAALEALSECGRAMLVTSAAVSGGFLLLLLSRFEGIANLGLLTGLTLWIAGIADAFLTPVLVMGWGAGIGQRSMRT